MLVDLNKDELKTISYALHEYCQLETSEDAVEYTSNLHLKIRNLSEVCTCKEDNNTA